MTKTVLIFSAPWCGNCGPYKERVKSADIDFTEIDVDTDEGAKLAQQHNIRSLPTTEIFDSEGNFVSSYTGTGNLSDIVSDLKKV